MLKVMLFCKDFGLKEVLTTLLQRFGEEYRLTLEIEERSVTGGHGKAITELQRFIREQLRYKQFLTLPILVLGIDANSQGYQQQVKQLKSLKEISDLKKVAPAVNIVYAVPDPHVERWLLLDPAAFKIVFGTGYTPTKDQGRKDEYKQQLREALKQMGLKPTMGGLE
jgi:hypothetical protein